MPSVGRAGAIAVGTLAAMAAVALVGAAEEIGPVTVTIESDGDPVHFRHDDGGTPADVGDDEFDVSQRIREAAIAADLGYFQGVGAPPPMTPALEQRINFQEAVVEHPFIALADAAERAIYDEYAPPLIHEALDIEFREDGYKIWWKVDTPVYQNDFCPEDKCYFPYFCCTYDKLYLIQVKNTSTTDGNVDVIDHTSEHLCAPSDLDGGLLCTGQFFDFPAETIYSVTPNVAFGYRLDNVSGSIDPGPIAAAREALAQGNLPNEALHDSTGRGLGRGGALDGVPRVEGVRAPSEPPARPSPGQVSARADETTVAPFEPFLPSLPTLWIAATLAALALLPLFLLYHRLRRDQVLSHETRAQILDLVRSNPGIHERALATRLGLKRQLVDYHAKHLARVGAITIRKVGNQKCLFENGGKYVDVEQRVLSVIQRGRTADVLAKLAAASEPVSQREIALALGVYESSVKWHLERLENLGLVSIERDDRAKYARLDPYARGVVEASVRLRGVRASTLDDGPRRSALDAWHEPGA